MNKDELKQALEAIVSHCAGNSVRYKDTIKNLVQYTYQAMAYIRRINRLIHNSKDLDDMVQILKAFIEKCKEKFMYHVTFPGVVHGPRCQLSQAEDIAQNYRANAKLQSQGIPLIPTYGGARSRKQRKIRRKTRKNRK